MRYGLAPERARSRSLLNERGPRPELSRKRRRFWQILRQAGESGSAGMALAKLVSVKSVILVVNVLATIVDRFMPPVTFGIYLAAEVLLIYGLFVAFFS